MPDMNKPELTSKELTMVSDQLEHEQLAITKLQAYAEQASDPDVKRMCEAGVRLHREHYETLLKHLNSAEKQG